MHSGISRCVWLAAVSIGLAALSVQGQIPGAQRSQAKSLATSRAQQQSIASPPKILSKGSPAEQENREAQAEPASTRAYWDVSVDWSLKLDAPTKELYERMATILSTVTTVPNDRLTYYSAINQPPAWVIERWIGMVKDVQAQVDGSYLVTAAAIPCMAKNSQLAILSCFEEQYLITQDSVLYQRSLDPKHWAGLMPWMSNL